MPVTVLSSMLAVPAFGLLGWGGMLLPATTLLHQAAWALLMGALIALILGITGSQMCRVVALPVPPLVVLPAEVIVPVLTALPTLVVKPMRPLLQRLPSAKRTGIFRFRYTPDEPDAHESDASEAP
jgi:hypothetical protein